MKTYAWIALALALACVACGSGERVIDTRTALSTLRQAGFRHLKVYSNGAAYQHLARASRDRARAANAYDVDTIQTRFVANPVLEPLLVIRYPDPADAKKDLANNQPLLHNQLTPAERSLLPHGYQVARVRLERVCNVLAYSYNSSASPVLTSRFDRSITMLRRKCS